MIVHLDDGDEEGSMVDGEEEGFVDGQNYLPAVETRAQCLQRIAAIVSQERNPEHQDVLAKHLIEHDFMGMAEEDDEEDDDEDSIQIMDEDDVP